MSFIKILGILLFIVTSTVVAIMGCANGGFAPGPSEYFLFEIDGTANKIRVFSINPSTGAIAQAFGSPYSQSGGGAPTGLATDPNMNFAISTNNGQQKIYSYSMSEGSGALSPVSGSPLSLSYAPSPLALTLNGRFVYVAEAINQFVHGYSFSEAGILSEISGSPFSTAGAGFFAFELVHPNGQFLYVSDENTPGIDGYVINSSTGFLTNMAGSPFDSGSLGNPKGMAIEPAGKYMYLADLTNGAVYAYSIASGTGIPTDIGNYVTNTPWDVTIDPSGQFLYVSAVGVYAYTINHSNGVLTPISGSPYTTGGTGESIVVDPTGNFLYEGDTSGIYAFNINHSNGQLTPVPGSPFTGMGSPVSLSVVKVVEPH